MLVETVVASAALFITAVATAIALWECIHHHKGTAAPETYALESTGSERFSQVDLISGLRYLGHN